MFLWVISAQANGQKEGTFSLRLTNVAIENVFREIEKTSNYRFIYQVDDVKGLNQVSLDVTDADINTILTDCFKDSQLEYVLENDYIVIRKSKEVKIVQTVDVSLIEIKGKVTDKNGYPLPGATVLENGTLNGVTTDVNGNFSIKVKDALSELKISFIGFTSQLVELTDKTEITIVLTESVNELATVNIISTGYQKVEKVKFLGAAENVANSYFENSHKANLQEGLQGSIAGVQILSNNSHPQAVPEVIIRGVGSAFQEGVGVVGFGAPTTVLGDPAILTPGSPLYVIDGVPTIDGSDLSSINGNDIKSISVLKDAAAASIYGARGANGVIVVETKSGTTGTTKVTYSTQVGFSDFTNLGKSLNTVELQELFVEGLINNTSNGITTEVDALAFLSNPGGSLNSFNANQNTNWGDELTRQSQMRQHNLSVSGGKAANRFYMSLGYLKNETAIKDVDFERVTFRLKYDTEISKKFNVSTNMSYGKTLSDNYETGTSYYSPFKSIYTLRPDFKVFNDDGSYDLSYNYGVNPLGILTDETRKLETNDFRGGVDLNYELIPGLTLESNLSGNYRFTENYNNFPDYIGKGLNNGSSFGIQQNTNILIWNTRTLLRYDLKLDENNSIRSFVGVEQNEVDTKITNVSVNNLRDGAETLDNGTTVDTYTKRSKTAISSMFLNTEYSYKDKYLVKVSLRRDGSSKFGPNKRFGNFYAVGLGWNIYKESFLENIEAFNFLKLRASYGMNGNDQIGSFNYIGTFSGTSFYNGQNAVTIASAGNASLGWEENTTFDVGIDFSLFKNRVSGFIEYYNRNTDKLLYNLGASAYNADTYIFKNFGGMKNSGFEISVNTKNIISRDNGFVWSTGITFTTNKNEITELDKDENISGNYLRKIGEDFNTLYLYGYAGVDPETGVELYYTDETETTTTTSSSGAVKYNHGKTTPDFYWSLTNTFSYKNFSLTAQLYSSWGGQIFETAGLTQNDNGYNGLRDYSNTSRAVYERRWQNPGDITDVPKYVYLNSRSLNTSSRWLHDASFIRLKKVELSYNFPRKILEKTFIKSLRLYVSADNIWTYVKDDTLDNDPEIGGITGGASFNAPLAKTVYFGLNASF